MPQNNYIHFTRLLGEYPTNLTGSYLNPDVRYPSVRLGATKLENIHVQPFDLEDMYRLSLVPLDMYHI